MKQRLSQTDCWSAAQEMANKYYQTEYWMWRNAVQERAESMIMANYDPLVLKVAAKSPSLFMTTHRVDMTFDYKTIRTDISFPFPVDCNGYRKCDISEEQYNELLAVYSEFKKVNLKIEELRLKIFKALYTLKTTKRIEDNFPSAMPFIKKVAGDAAEPETPSNLDELKEMFDNIK